MVKEEWKDIKGYEGLYQISNLGNVKSLNTNKNMKFTTRSGYYNIILRKNGKRYSKQVHRLVAEAFLENKENKFIVNHKDYNRKNNNIENLEWCTQKENVIWSKNNMKHRHKTNYSNTGQQYISYRKSTNRYRITIDKKEYKSCKTLEEAIIERNRILNEIDNTK